MVEELDEGDDFFGLREVTETPMPRHMEAARILRSRAAVRKQSELSGDVSANVDTAISKNRTASHPVQEQLDECIESSMRNGRDHKNTNGEDIGLFLKTYTDSGLAQIWDRIEPVWKMSDEQLIEMMASRVVYEDEELIAFDKPYQMAYSRAPIKQAELLRILPQLSSRLLHKAGYLRIIKSLAKPVTGVIIFAKNENAEQKTKASYTSGMVEHYYRVITNMTPVHQEAAIDIPLIKCRRKNNNYIMLPIGANSNKGNPLLEAQTKYRVIKSNNKNHTTYMECITNRDVQDQVRAHLGIGIACPIIGDLKYNFSRRETGKGIPPRLSDSAMLDLCITGNSFRRLPLYIHLKEVVIRLSERNSRNIHICAPIPSFFTYTLSKLRLLRK